MSQEGYSYIASPYSAVEWAHSVRRYKAVRAFTAFCVRRGNFVFSPIIHCHDLALECELPKDAVFWERFNYAMLFPAKTLLVLTLDGWEESKGVKMEIAWAKELKKPIFLVSPFPDYFTNSYD